MSNHRVNNKCNRVKRQHWRWLIYTLRNFYYIIICSVFSEATTTVLESFINSTGKHLCWSLFLKKLQACRPISCLFFSLYSIVHVILLSFVCFNCFNPIFVHYSRASCKSIYFLLIIIYHTCACLIMKMTKKTFILQKTHLYNGHSFILYIL